jgi:hypothetical protein
MLSSTLSPVEKASATRGGLTGLSNPPPKKIIIIIIIIINK